MNCVNCYVEPQKLNGLSITILDVFDDYALSNAVREDMYKCYPTAKLAHLKSGGNFPYLSRSDEVNLHIQVSVKKIVEHYVFQCTAALYLYKEPAWLKWSWRKPQIPPKHGAYIQACLVSYAIRS